MKKAVIWGAVIIVLLIVGKCGLSAMFSGGETNNAKERVRRVLDGLKPHGDRQHAVMLWMNGSFNAISGEQFQEAANLFDDWAEKNKLNDIRDYTIKDAKVIQQSERLGDSVVRVTGTIDGKPFSVRVIQGRQLELER